MHVRIAQCYIYNHCISKSYSNITNMCLGPGEVFSEAALVPPSGLIYFLFWQEVLLQPHRSRFSHFRLKRCASHYEACVKNYCFPTWWDHTFCAAAFIHVQHSCWLLSPLVLPAPSPLLPSSRFIYFYFLIFILFCVSDISLFPLISSPALFVPLPPWSCFNVPSEQNKSQRIN